MLTDIIPQANEPWRLVAVAVAADAGCTSSAEIADALGLDKRQGAYYGAAAQALGLLDRPGGDTAWAPTSLGRDLAAKAELYADRPEELAAHLAGIIGTDPRVESLVDVDAADLRDHVEVMCRDFQLDGLAPTTARRRASTAATWAAFVRDQTAEHADQVAASVAHATAALPAILAEQERRLEAARAATEAARPKVCRGCYMQLPATGVCDGCC